MEQRPRFRAQDIDQVLKIDVPGSLLPRGALGTCALADPVAAQLYVQAAWCSLTVTRRPIKVGGTE